MLEPFYIRQVYEKQNFDLFKPYLPWKYPSNWLKNIKWFFRSFRLAAQRIKRGYSDYDITDLDSYLTGLMACALDDFSKKNIGVPQEYINKYKDEDKAIVIWNQQVRAVSSLLFQSLECLEEENYNVPEMPGEVSFKDGKVVHEGATEEEIARWLDGCQKVRDARHVCLMQAFEWLKEHWWDLWI